MTTLSVPFDEAEVNYITGLVVSELRRMTEQGDHARSHGTRGFEATDHKVARGVHSKLLAVRDAAAYEAGVRAAQNPQAKLISASLCDGEHAAPECTDPNCWLRG